MTDVFNTLGNREFQQTRFLFLAEKVSCLGCGWIHVRYRFFCIWLRENDSRSLVRGVVVMKILEEVAELRC